MTRTRERPPAGDRKAQETTGGYVRPDRTPPCRLCPLCECGYRDCREDALALAVVDALRGGRHG